MQRLSLNESWNQITFNQIPMTEIYGHYTYTYILWNCSYFVILSYQIKYQRVVTGWDKKKFSQSRICDD